MKSSKLLLVPLFLALAVLFTGCPEKEGANNASATGTDGTYGEYTPVSYGTTFKDNAILDINDDNKVTFESMSQYFVPDYTPETPDVILDDSATANTSNGKNTKHSDSVIPGLRELSKYKTQYQTERSDPPKVTDTDISKEYETTVDGKAVEFKISDWGPYQIASENEYPTFYVIFSKPVKALSALGDVMKTCSEMSIEPAIEGVFRWYGSDHLSFEASEPATPGVVYTIKVNQNVKSMAGDKLKGDTTFKTKSAPVLINTIYGGFSKEGDWLYDSSTGALPPAENRFLLITNYKLPEANLANDLTVKVDGKTAKVTVEPYYEDLKFYVWSNRPSYNKEQKRTNAYVVTIKDSVPHGVSVQVVLNSSGSTASYKTLSPFNVSFVNSYAKFSEGKYGNPLKFGFTQKPEIKSLVANLSINMDYKITEKNISISGREVTLYDLPVEQESSYQLTFGTGIKDIYGQSIGISNPKTYTFQTRALPGFVKYLDYGAKIMEAQYPHKILYEYQNVLDSSYYVIRTTPSPLDTSYSFECWNNKAEAPEDIRTEIDSKTKDTRLFEEINLDPYLTNGYGWVEFEAHTKLMVNSYWRDAPYKEDYSNKMTIQVTDLGVTARIGLNKAVILVRSLATNKPVANADVSINYAIEGKTDSNGLCVINFTESQVETIEGISDRTSFQILVQKGDDKVVFYPSSHNTWREGIYTGYLYRARTPKQRTFMFVDRGLYKPGETVTFRGIDRDQLLGTLKAKHTGYKISVEGAWWDSDEIIPSFTGETTESGGFYGSFQLPEDLGPGTYRINYSRNGNRNSTESITFVVANFERLKFEASASITDMNYYGGDSLAASIKASYLAGGALSDASYEATWYKAPSYFDPSTPETKGYYFANADYDDSRTYYSEVNGTLDSNGTATVTCETQKISNGKPYTYNMEAYITDVSNQRISTSASVLVHPASYYLGVSKPAGVKGYPKKGTKLDFPLIFVDSEGHALSEDAMKARVTSVNYTLSREEWTLVNTQSVDEGVYTRYELQTITDQEGTFTPSKSKDTLSLTPKECGWYTLKLEGKDAKNNVVKTTYEFYVTGGRSFWFDSYNAQSLKLTPDQNQYNPGDTAQILLESQLPEGDYLITVEREGIFTEEIKHFDSPANIIEIPIAGNYVPVVYVSVSSYSIRSGAPKHQYGEVDLDKPKAYYGVTPVYVNPDVRTFSVKIESDKTAYKPGEDATLTLTATRGGKPVSGAELTVMAVDRGVLDLINYHVPNPIDYFYNSFNYPLYVRGGDNRGMIMDPVTYSIKNLTGGDSDETKEEERKDFRPTAVFEPSLVTDANGQVTCKFKMPDSLTTYRITAFGVKNDYFALKESEVKVQNPVNIQQVQPRKLRERDTAEAGVLITNLQNVGYDITVSAEVRSPSGNTAEDEAEGRTTVAGKGFIDGESKHKVYVAPGESTVVYFDVAAQTAGTVELVYTIKSDIINEKLVSPIKIEKTYVYETVAVMGQTEGGDAKTSSTEQLIIPSWAKDARGDVKFTLDATRLGLLGTSVNYLFEYPYGCMEQQSARVLPLVLFDEYIDIFEMDMSSKISNTKKCVTSFTKQWGKVQLSNGGFPYWPSGKEANLYVSTRIAQIYGAAKKRGYTDKELGYDINALCSYIAKAVKADSNKISDFQKAFACYVLKLNGSKLLDSELTSLYNRHESLQLSSMAYVGLAYAEAGDSKKAKELADAIRPYVQPVERSVSISSKDKNRSWYWYEDSSSEMALILQLFVTTNPDDKMVDRLVLTLLQKQSHGYWTSTATTAKVLDSIYTYIKKRNLDKTNYTATVEVNKKQVMKESFKNVTDKPKTLNLPFEDKTIASLKKDKGIPVTFEKNGSGYLFYTMVMRYALPDEMQNYRNEGIDVSYILRDLESGSILNTTGSKDTSLVLETGKVYEATVTISSTRSREYVALRCPIPSGAEILDSTFVTSGSQAINSSFESWWSNQSILDNEIQFFWDWFYNGTRTVKYRFRTARRGVYPTPPVQVECMYEPEVFGRSDGYLYQIK